MSQTIYKPVADGEYMDGALLVKSVASRGINTIAIRSVHDDGRAYWSGSSLPDGWRLCEAVEGPKADWSRAPAWAQWWACDPNGWGHWFEEEPLLSLTITYCGWVPKTINGVQIGAELWAGEIEIPLGIDWRTLIEPRPATKVQP